MDRALARRNWVLKEMRNNDWINKTQYEEAITQPLGTVRQQSTARFERVGGYYIEEVRRRLIDLFGETAKDVPHSVSAGGRSEEHTSELQSLMRNSYAVF